LLTGLYPHQAGIGHIVGNDGIPSYQGFLHDRCLTLAEALKPAGYATLMTGKWHVGSAPGHWPLDRGFDRYWGTPSGGGVYFKDTLLVRTNVFFVDGAQRIEPPDNLYVTDKFTDRALEFIDDAVTRARQPFFLYLAHIAPHWPLQAKPADIARYEDRYDIGWDEVRARRFERQQQMGLIPPDTRLSPRDPQGRPWSERSAPDREELAHRMAIYAAQVDCIDQNERILRGPLFYEHEGNKAVRQGDWKAVAPRGGEWELYHLASDRTETRDLAAQHPEKTTELADLWQAWAERCGVWEWEELQRQRRARARN
jgi:arylsulfatase A-like enzyme